MVEGVTMPGDLTTVSVRHDIADGHLTSLGASHITMRSQVGQDVTPRLELGLTPGSMQETSWAKRLLRVNPCSMQDFRWAKPFLVARG